MLRLVYRSTAIRPFTNEQLVALLRTSKKNNADDNITGLLLHSNAQFFQVLEGPEDAVRRTFERISRDPRHANIEIVFEEKTTTRLFSDWSMGFLPTEDLPDDARENFNVVIMQPTATNKILPEPTMVRLLLKTFQTSAIR